LSGEIKSGNRVKVQDFEDDFKVISATKMGNSTRYELFNLRDNTVRTYFSPPVKIKRLLSPVEKAIAGEFDDPEHFNLMVEANRLSCMYLYDPILSLSTTKITVYPHQVEAVYRMLDSFWPRYLLADDAGLGKTIMAGMLIKELELRKRIGRVLIVVPAALTYQWRRELSDRFDERFAVMDSSRLKALFDENPEENPWATYDRVITSLDFVKRENIRDEVALAGWDLTIIDEAHKLAAHQSGKKAFRTRRFMLGEALQDNSDSLLFLTATPHSGESYAYRRLLSLLDPYAFALGNPITTENLKRVMIRRTKETVRTLDGQELFPPRIAKTLVVGFSEEEKGLYDAVVNYVTHYFNLATKSGNRGVTFAMIILQKRMASGIAAITKSLENRLNRLREIKSVGGSPQNYEFDNGQELKEDDEVTLEDLEEKEKEVIEKRYELLTMAKNVEELNQEIVALEELVKIADAVTSDSKAEALMSFVKSVHNKDPLEKILIFTEYKDTLNDLVDRLKPETADWKTEVATIHGGMKIEERIQQEEKFKLPNVPIMVATDAAGEGLNLQFAHLMVNYELPWNPNRLEQRIGRLHRIGQTKKVIIHNMLIQNTIEGDIFKRLLDKIEIIKEEIGDRVFDVLGLLMQDIKIEDLVMQSVGKDSEWVRSEISNMEWVMDDAKRRLIENIENKSLIKDSLDLATIQKLIGKSEESRLTPAELERYLSLFLKSEGGKIEKIPNELEIFNISLPKDLMHDEKISKSLYIQGIKILDGAKKSFRDCRPITFTKEIAEKNKDVRFVALGHPLLSRIIDSCLQPNFGGNTALKMDPDGHGGSLFIFKCRIVDAENNIRGEKLLSIIWDRSNNLFREVDASAFWEMDKSSDIETAATVVDSAESFNKVYEEAQIFASELTEGLFENIKQKVEKEVLIKIDDTRNYREKAVNILNERIAENEARLRLKIGNQYVYNEQEAKQNIGRNKAAIKRIETTTEAAFQKLKLQAKLVCDAPECLAVAVLIPGKNVKKVSDSDPESFLARKMQLEKLSLDFVMKKEKEEGRKPIDVSKMFKGYDIVSEGNKEKRFIEVKSFKETGPLELTSHEWIVSQRLENKYWLYIIENVEDSEEITMTKVNHPFSVFSNVSKKISLLQYKILIDQWKAFLNTDQSTCKGL
jgi:SNF2 family DNA or RNA helicase